MFSVFRCYHRYFEDSEDFEDEITDIECGGGYEGYGWGPGRTGTYGVGLFVSLRQLATQQRTTGGSLVQNKISYI